MNLSEILIQIHTFLNKKMHLKMSGKCRPFCLGLNVLTHWGRVTHICVHRLTITGSDNGLSPRRGQAIIWTNAGMLLIEPLGTNFSENSIEVLTFSFTKMRLKVSPAKWRPFCLGPNVLICTEVWWCYIHHLTVYPNDYAHSSCYVLFCSGVVYCQLVLSISFRVTSLALWQFYYCPGAREATVQGIV